MNSSLLDTVYVPLPLFHHLDPDVFLKSPFLNAVKLNTVKLVLKQNYPEHKKNIKILLLFIIIKMIPAQNAEQYCGK